MSLVLGVDVGTSGVKSLAIDTDTGEIVARGLEALPLHTPRAGWAEQDAMDMRHAAFASIRSMVAALGPRSRDVRAIGLTGQMHSAVVLDEAGVPVRDAILWCDTRTHEECRELRQALGSEGLAREAGNDALEGFTLPKLLWLRRHEPANFARVRHVLMPKDWIGYLLTGTFGADFSDASGTLAFHPGERRWNPRILDAAEIRASWFPDAAPSTAVLGGLSGGAARELGLRDDVLVVRGAADNPAAAVGLGVLSSDRAMVSLGTSGVVFQPTPSYVVDDGLRLHSFCHATDGWYWMGVMLAAGGALRWYRDTLSDGEKLAAELRRTDPYEIITEAASTSAPGAGGVRFLPYLMGERTPHRDAHARGVFAGMSGATTKADMSRAVLEGVTFGLADCTKLMREVGAAHRLPMAREVRVTGGGARSAFWRQLVADVLDVEVVLTNSSEGPALGAALLAAVGAGHVHSLPDACDRFVHVAERRAPEPSMTARYADAHEEFRSLYGALRSWFGR